MSSGHMHSNSELPKSTKWHMRLQLEDLHPRFLHMQFTMSELALNIIVKELVSFDVHHMMVWLTSLVLR